MRKFIVPAHGFDHERAVEADDIELTEGRVVFLSGGRVLGFAPVGVGVYEAKEEEGSE